MLQYIGLKDRHECSYEKFQEFLVTLKQWEIYHQTIVNVREKYSAKNHRLPKIFTTEVPGVALYRKYKDSFHLITPVAPITSIKPSVIDIPELIVAAASVDREPPILTGVN